MPTRAIRADAGPLVAGEAEPVRGKLLPALRQDIELHQGVRMSDGAPSWVLVDPASGAFYHIGWVEFEILSRWGLATPDSIAAAVSRETTLAVGSEHVEQVRRFFDGNGLLRAAGPDLARRQHEARRRQRAWGGAALLQRLLYMRVPLFEPRRLLAILTPLAAPLFQPAFWLALGLVLVVALHLLGRQWSAFAAGVGGIASLEGAAAIAGTLIVAKIAHELGHAVTATRYGADVPVMGVSLVLGCPLLYTETSAAWTLRIRSQRIAIALAGVAAETVLAILALLAWSLLDAGPLRTAAAFAATTLVVLTLVVNANPLMRFDGYFVLAEMMGIDNLQARAFQRVRWRLGRVFAGERAADPEPQLPAATRRLLEGYGFAALAYRGLVYVGIVYAIDRMLFPALAVPLSVAVVGLFVLKPLMGEIVALGKLASRNRDTTALARATLATGALLVILLVPWRTTVSIPVVYEAGETFDVFTPEPARVGLVAARQGEEASKGQVLFWLTAPDIEQRLERTQVRAAMLDRLLDQHVTGDSYRDGVRVYEQELAKATAELAGLMERRAQLVIGAPASGRLTMVEPGLWPGLSVAPDRPLAQLVAAGAPRVTGYADERELSALKAQARAVVWLDGRPDVSYPATVETVFTDASRALDHPMLATQYGGPLAARPGPDRRLVPDSGVYKVALRLDAPAQGVVWPDLRMRGFARVETPARNLVSRIWTRLAGLVRRELG